MCRPDACQGSSAAPVPPPTSVSPSAPTPIQELRVPEAVAMGNHIFVKRDDLIPCALGGNKVRIAREFLRDLRARGCDALIMYGDLRSNLCRVLALLCHAAGVPCLMVATSEGDVTGPSFNQDVIGRLGVEVLACEKTNIAATVDLAFERLAAQGRRPYYIYGDRTGSGNEGVPANAYARAYEEICAQEQGMGLRFDLLVTPYGTGCTQGGLVCGSLRAGDDRQIVGISISSRPRERALAVLDATIRAWFEREGGELPADYLRHVNLRTEYTCGGYGSRDARVDALIERMLVENGLPLDPTYTGKAFRGMLDYLKDQGICEKNVLFLHTGGTPLFYDYLSSTRGHANSN